MEAILFVLRTGCQWAALRTTGICHPSSAYRRFREWAAAGVFHQLWRHSLFLYEIQRGIDWRWLSMDGAMTKAPLGGEATGPNPTDRAKRGTKRSILTDAAGIPLALVVDGANRHDFKLMRRTLLGIQVERPIPSRREPQGVCLDKGYDFPEARRMLLHFGFTPHIHARGQPIRELRRELGEKGRRWPVERTHSWMNRFRRLLVRWEKRADTYLAMLHLALGIITFKRADAKDGEAA